MDKNFEKAKGLSSEWRTPQYFFDRFGLTFDLDPCAPIDDGYYAVPARKTFTVVDDGLRQPWTGLTFCNPPWSVRRDAVVPWLRRFLEHEGGGIFVCVARTSCWWFHELIYP